VDSLSREQHRLFTYGTHAKGCSCLPQIESYINRECAATIAKEMHLHHKKLRAERKANSSRLKKAPQPSLTSIIPNKTGHTLCLNQLLLLRRLRRVIPSILIRLSLLTLPVSCAALVVLVNDLGWDAVEQLFGEDSE